MCDRVRWAVRRILRKGLDDKRGTTLVELIVTFALIGLFMTAATGMLTSSLQMFGRMQATSSAITLSDLILDKVSGEIAAADIPKKTEGSNSGYYFWLEPEVATQGVKSRWVVFRNRSKSPVAVFAAPATEGGKADVTGMGKGQLYIRYYAVSKEEQKAVEEIDWHFDSKVYMDYTIENLSFSRENAGEHPNVVRIDLTLRNTKTGFEYSSYRYAENYNYDFKSNYMCARDEIEPGNRAFPLEAKEFEIKPSEGGGGGGEPEVPEEPDDLPDGWVQLTIIHKVVTYDGIYSDVVLKEEVKRQKFDMYTPWIEAQQLYGAEAAGYTCNGGYQQVPVNLAEPRVEYIYYYTPKEIPYCTICYNQETGEWIKRGDEKKGLYGQNITVSAEHIAGFEVVGEQSLTRPLIWTEAYVDDGPNAFKFYYKSLQTPVSYIVYYKCGDIELGMDTGTGSAGETIMLTPKNFSGYSPKEWYHALRLNNGEDCKYTFEYNMNEWNGGAPFPPVGPYIEIEIEAKQYREPTDMENQIAQDIFRFFNEGWTTIEVSGAEYLTGAYRIFELNGEKYAVAGGTNREKFENSLQAELMKKEGVGKDNIIEIKKDDISSEAKRKVFLEYILKNAGASEEYIKEIHDIDIEFDKDDNPKRLKEVSFKNKQGEEIKIKYK